MTNLNPIATILGIKPVKSTLTILGRHYQYMPAANGYGEGMYRADAGHGVSNPCFSISPYAGPDNAGGAQRLGQYLTGKRQGVKRAEAEAALARAINNVDQMTADHA
jgi:hypothetical protein